MPAAEFFDNSLTYNMVWQAGEWLGADNISGTAVNEFEHLTGQEPASPVWFPRETKPFAITARSLILEGGVK